MSQSTTQRATSKFARLSLSAFLVGGLWMSQAGAPAQAAPQPAPLSSTPTIQSVSAPMQAASAAQTVVIDFNNVRVTWPVIYTGSQEDGFNIASAAGDGLNIISFGTKAPFSGNYIYNNSSVNAGSITITKLDGGKFDYTGMDVDQGPFPPYTGKPIIKVEGFVGGVNGTLLGTDIYQLDPSQALYGWPVTAINLAGKTVDTLLITLDKQGNTSVGEMDNIRLQYTSAANLTVVKSAVGGDGTFNFTSTTLSPATFSLTTTNGAAQTQFTGLISGTYDVSETVPAGWALSGASCSDGSNPNSISLPSGADVTCTFTNTQKGGIIIEKRTAPAGGTGYEFTQNIDNTGVFTLDDAGQKTFSNVLPGSYVVTETASLGSRLTGLTCDDGSSATPSVTSVATRAATINVDAGETVRCIYTNSADDVIIIQKLTEPAGSSTPFSFSVDGITATTNFTLADGGVNAILATTGTFTVTESNPGTGWDIAAIDCEVFPANVNDPSTPVSGITNTGSVLFTLTDPGQAVFCLYTNRQRGTINIVKQANPVDATAFPFSQNIDGSGAFTLTHGQTQTFANVPAGSYTVTETLLSGWSLPNVSCTSGASTTSVQTGGVAINLAASDTVTCTFKNTKTGSLTVVKNAIGGDDAFSFSTKSLPTSTFTLTTSGGTAQTTFNDLKPGIYGVTENVTAGWSTTGATCDNGYAPDKVNVAAGANVTCTFTNTKTSTLTVVKETTPADDTIFEFSLGYDALSPTQFSLQALTNPSTTLSLAAAGVYTLTEAVTAGWTLTDAACTSATGASTFTKALPSVAIQMAAGDDVTCTYKNTKVVTGTATLTIIKQTLYTSGTFTFTSQTLSPATFSLTTTQPTINSLLAQRTFSNLAPGTYDVTEVVPAGWITVSATCSNGDSPTSITLAANEVVTCTFINRWRHVLLLPLIYH